MAAETMRMTIVMLGLSFFVEEDEDDGDDSPTLRASKSLLS